jgi:hypothetical protein
MPYNGNILGPMARTLRLPDLHNCILVNPSPADHLLLIMVMLLRGSTR